MFGRMRRGKVTKRAGPPRSQAPVPTTRLRIERGLLARDPRRGHLVFVIELGVRLR
jgi:hypothetical protein